MSNSAPGSFDPQSITRPDRRLLQYYILIALFSGPFFPIVFLPLYFKDRFGQLADPH